MDCTSGIESVTPRRVTRPKEFDEQVSFLAAKGTHERIEAVLGEGERKVDFLRDAVEKAVKRRGRRK